MTFEATLYIQGVANFVPHENGDSLLVLFPEQERAIDRGIPRPGDEEICRHYAVVQIDSRCLVPEMPRLWLTLDLAGHWVGFESDSQVEMELDQNPIRGVASLEELLERVQLGGFTGIDPSALPGSGIDPDLLAAGLVLNGGRLRPDSDYEGEFTFQTLGKGGAGLTQDLTSVVKAELGNVGHVTMKLRPLAGGETTRIPLRPVGDTLGIWIRHFCDLREPDPRRETPEAGQLDADFVLNYALREDLPGLLQSAPLLPIPQVPASWVAGGPIGGDPHQCMPSQEAARAFDDPFGT